MLDDSLQVRVQSSCLRLLLSTRCCLRKREPFLTSVACTRTRLMAAHHMQSKIDAMLLRWDEISCLCALAEADLLSFQVACIKQRMPHREEALLGLEWVGRPIRHFFVSIAPHHSPAHVGTWVSYD